MTDKATIRELRKRLRELTHAVQVCLAAWDAQMDLPSSPQRGANLATIANHLGVANDIARHYGLGEPFPLKPSPAPAPGTPPPSAGAGASMSATEQKGK